MPKAMIYSIVNSLISETISEVIKDNMSSIGSMNATLKNNRKLLKNGKRKPFTKMNGPSKKELGYKPYVLPEVSPHVLRRIRIKTRRQNRRLLIKQISIGVVVLITFLYLIFLL